PLSCWRQWWMTDRMWSEGAPLILSPSCGNTHPIDACITLAEKRRNGSFPFLLMRLSAEQLADRFLAFLDDADRPTLRCVDFLAGVDAQDLADAGHEVLDGDGTVDHLGADPVGLADGLAALDTAADEHAAPGLRPVIAAADILADADLRRPAEL